MVGHTRWVAVVRGVTEHPFCQCLDKALLSWWTERLLVACTRRVGRKKKEEGKYGVTAFHLAPDKKGSQAGKWAGVQERPTHGAQ